jgi:hypothetical protein
MVAWQQVKNNFNNTMYLAACKNASELVLKQSRHKKNLFYDYVSGGLKVSTNASEFFLSIWSSENQI